MPKKQTETTPDYGSYNSYPLTMEQVKEAMKSLQWDLIEDATSEKAGVLLAVLRSFAYTTDHTARENRLGAAEESLMPYIEETHNALKRIAIKAHQQLISVGREQ